MKETQERIDEAFKEGKVIKLTECFLEPTDK